MNVPGVTDKHLISYRSPKFSPRAHHFISDSLHRLMPLPAVSSDRCRRLRPRRHCLRPALPLSSSRLTLASPSPAQFGAALLARPPGPSTSPAPSPSQPHQPPSPLWRRPDATDPLLPGTRHHCRPVR
jgi:hypothetical protein